MGFYGNITNVANTTFQFDKIYPNRLDMEAHCNSDGIMVGRYVLVEYDTNAAYPVIVKDGDKFYPVGATGETRTAIKYAAGEIPMDHNPTDTFYKGEIAQEQGKDTVIFYQCDGGDSEGNAIFIELTKVNSTNTYITNFAIDEKQYANSGDKFTGYDSTVWVKTSDTVGDAITTHYVNIASLNSVVPTFDVVADAPTMTPITPHFDSDSTNVYYKLHMQSPYGFRVAESKDGKSDESTTWYETTYDKSSDTITTSSKVIDKAAIYYNKDGFDEKTISKVEDDNYIKLEPSAKSGAVYSHGKEENDIQEFSFHLPAIGNMMSDAWNIIHGPFRDDEQGDKNSSLQGRLNSFQGINNNQIPVKRADGTLVGTHINGAHAYDMTTIEEAPLMETNFTSDDAWIKTTVDSSTLQRGDKETQSNNNGIAIHHTWTKGKDTTSKIDINDEKDTFNIVTPIADNAGHIVAHNTETVTLPYGYKSVTVGEQSDATTNPDINTTQVIADNVKDNITIGSSNKWIRMSGKDDKTNEIKIGHEVHTPTTTKKSDTDINGNGDTITLQDIEFDEAGHMTANQNHTYTLPYGFKQITINNSNNATAPNTNDDHPVFANSTQDTLFINAGNNWIQFNTDDDANTIEVGHKLSTLAKGLHDSTDKKIESFGDSFNVVNFTTDEAGHVTGASTTTITTPVGSYNTGTTNGNKTVLTGFEYTPSSGAIKTYSEDVGTLKLSGYNTSGETAGTGVSITSDNTINEAFAQIQTKINSMNNSSSGTATFISSITQTNGKITDIGRSTAGTLQLGIDSSDTGITKNSTLSAAINTLLLRITQEKEARENAINTLYGDKDDISAAFDTIQEIAAWLDGSDENSNSVEKLVASINKNATAISEEQGRAETAENTLLNKINNINVSDTAQTNQYVNAVSQSGGKITVSRATLPVYSVAEGTANGSIRINGSTNVSVKGLGTAAYTDSSTYVQQTAYETEIAALRETISVLTNRIEALENPTE